MRICIVTSSFRRFEGDYAGQHVYAQAVGLSRRHDVHVIYPTDRDNPGKAGDPFHHHPFPYPFRTYPMAQVRGTDIFNIIPLFTRMRSEIRKAKQQYNIDLFYAFWTVPSAFVCSFSCGKTPYIIGLAGSDDKVFGRGGIARPFVKHALGKADKVISLSQGLKREAIDMGVREDNISVIPSGINIDEYRPGNKTELRTALGLPDGFLAIYAGSLFKLKRIEWLVRISAGLGPTHSFHSLIVGDGPEKESLVKMAAEMNASNVRFLGKIPYQKVPLYLAASDVLVLFSETEGLPSCVQEAMASGIPAVVTDVGGVKDIVQDGVTGYTVNSEYEARERLALLVESPELAYRMGANARKFAEEYLSHESVFRQVNAVCESVVPRAHTPVPEIPIKKYDIGIISTFPASFISYFIEVHSPYSRKLHVIAPELHRNDVDYHPLKYKIGRNPFSQIINQVVAQVRMSREVIRAGRKVDFWSFLGGDVFFLPILTARLMGTPVMLSLLGNLEYETIIKNNVLNPIQRFLRRINCVLANRIIIYSGSLAKKWCLSRYKNKILVAQSQFVDLERFRVKTPLNKRPKLVGYVGRLSPEKGIWNLIECMPLVLQEDGEVRLLIVGGGPLHPRIKEYLEMDGLKGNVHLEGKIPFEQVPDRMNELRLLVLPSYSEGLPATLLEAMACGTPVLATPAGAVDEIITSGKTGFLLEDNSREAIAKGIVNALNHPDGEGIAGAARHLVEEEYSLRAARRNYREVIHEGSLLSRKHNR